MNLINLISRPHKEAPESIAKDNCLEKLSKIPFLNTLLERVSCIENTNIEFNGKYIDMYTDIAKLNKSILSFHYKTELSSLKNNNKTLNEESKKTQKILNEMAKEWYRQEKINMPITIIKREIDKICAKKKANIPGNEMEKIIDLVNKKHIKNDILATGASVCSIIPSLKGFKNLENKINENGIKKNLTKDMKTEIPEKLKLLEEQLNKKNIEQKKNELPGTTGNVIFQDLSIVTAIAGEIKSDIYNILAENIYNTLLCDTETERPLDFDAIKMETRIQAEKLLDEKNTSQKKELSIENFIHQQFYSETKVTYSSAKRDLDDLLNMLDSNSFKGDISDQRAQFNPGTKVTSSASSQSAFSVNNMPDQNIDDIFDIMDSPAFTDRTDNQRASLGNKKA